MHFHVCFVALVLAVSSTTVMSGPCIVRPVNHGKVGKYEIIRLAKNRSKEYLNQRSAGDKIDDGDSMTLCCEEGYTPAGSSQIYKILRLKEVGVTCDDGAWSKPLLCEAEIACGKPPPIQFATVKSLFTEHYPVGSIVAYECQHGYVIKGRTTTSQCVMSSDGSQAVWTKVPMSCVEVTCDEPQSPKHVLRQFSDGLKVDSLVLYSCEKDKILVGASTSKCLSDGQWTFPSPKCVDRCEVPHIENGRIAEYPRKSKLPTKVVLLEEGSKVNPDKSHIFFCQQDFVVEEGSSRSMKNITCEDGTWSDPLQCIPVLCDGDPPSMKNGFPVINKRTHGHVIYYVCDKFYTKTREGHVECFHGRWKGTTPVCTPP